MAMTDALWAFATFAVGFAVAALATPLVSRLALALDVVDRPNERKVSARQHMPLMGGLAVALGFWVAIAFSQLLAPTGADLQELLPLLVGGALVLALGIADDRFGLSAPVKLAVQLVAATIAIHDGNVIERVTNPLTGEGVTLAPWLGWVVTCAWIVIVTNAINLIDGLDGLCAGVSAIITLALTAVAHQAGYASMVVAGIALAGALLGFLPRNFPPARIFIGDTGALFVGFCLSLLALGSYKRATVITFLVPLLAFAVPLLDTALSILRRLRTGRGVMQADRLHMHHRLLHEYHGDHRPAVLSLYGLTACFCLIAVSFTRLEGITAVLFLAIVVLLTLRILRNLGFASIEDPRAQRPAAARDNGERR
jgi:UDP-GlcNAc:undecaprenyl-phosphate GlcNAc-1-phosphate transferase